MSANLLKHNSGKVTSTKRELYGKKTSVEFYRPTNEKMAQILTYCTSTSISSSVSTRVDSVKKELWSCLIFLYCTVNISDGYKFQTVLFLDTFFVRNKNVVNFLQVKYLCQHGGFWTVQWSCKRWFLTKELLLSGYCIVQAYYSCATVMESHPNNENISVIPIASLFWDHTHNSLSGDGYVYQMILFACFIFLGKESCTA